MNSYKPSFKLSALTYQIRLIMQDYEKYSTPFVHYPEPDEE